MTRLRQTPQPTCPAMPAGAGAHAITTAGRPGSSGLPERRALAPDTRPRPSLNGFLFSAPEKGFGGEKFSPSASPSCQSQQGRPLAVPQWFAGTFK